MIYQDFGSVADNTALNGFVTSDGTTIVCDPINGASTTAIVLGGKVVPNGNTYPVVPVPFRNAHIAMEMSWPTTVTLPSDQAVACLVLGRRRGGAIIQDMIHVVCNFQSRPYLSRWLAGTATNENAFAIIPKIISDGGLSVIPAGTKTRFDVMVRGNYVTTSVDNGRIVSHYYEPSFSSLVGDSGVAGQEGYAYFQMGTGLATVSHLPRLHSLQVTELTADEASFFPPFAELSPPNEDLSYTSANLKGIPKNTSLNVFSVTPIGTTNLRIKCHAMIDGTNSGYCDEQSEWDLTISNYGGSISVFGPTLIGSRLPHSINSGVLAVQATLNTNTFGSIVVIGCYSLVTGSGPATASVTNSPCHLRVESMGSLSPVTPI